jgi:hypothetical protein
MITMLFNSLKKDTNDYNVTRFLFNEKKKINKKVSVLPVVIHRMELELELCEMVYFS